MSILMMRPENKAGLRAGRSNAFSPVSLSLFFRISATYPITTQAPRGRGEGEGVRFMAVMEKGMFIQLSSICHLLFPCDIIRTRVFKIGSQNPFCKRISVGSVNGGLVATHHGGEIWAESEPRHGSTFIFVLPA
jgi:hypothetical protein